MGTDAMAYSAAAPDAISVAAYVARYYRIQEGLTGDALLEVYHAARAAADEALDGKSNLSLQRAIDLVEIARTGSRHAKYIPRTRVPRTPIATDIASVAPAITAPVVTPETAYPAGPNPAPYSVPMSEPGDPVCTLVAPALNLTTFNPLRWSKSNRDCDEGRECLIYFSGMLYGQPLTLRISYNATYDDRGTALEAFGYADVLMLPEQVVRSQDLGKSAVTDEGMDVTMGQLTSAILHDQLTDVALCTAGTSAWLMPAKSVPMTPLL